MAVQRQTQAQVELEQLIAELILNEGLSLAEALEQAPALLAELGQYSAGWEQMATATQQARQMAVAA